MRLEDVTKVLPSNQPSWSVYSRKLLDRFECTDQLAWIES